MFNLENAIVEWRQRMQRAGINALEVLQELENHLREDVAAQVRAGTNEREAFEAAVGRMGEPKALKAEFAKKNRGSFLRGLKAKLAELIPMRHPAVVPALADFTANAQQTLALAREEAPRLHHDFIGTEHVLLGLTQAQSGIVPQILQRMGVSSEKVRREIEKFVGLGQPAPRVAEKIPFTPRAKQALAIAAEEAKVLKSERIGAEHIFLGLLMEGSGVAAIVLKELGVDIEKTRAEILREAAGN